MSGARNGGAAVVTVKRLPILTERPELVRFAREH
jgi:hypothetical protein